MRILRLNLETGEVNVRMSKAMYCLSNSFSQALAPDGTHYFIAERTNQPAQLWRRLPSHPEPQLLCDLNPNVKPELSSVLESVRWQRIEWLSPTGKTLAGALMLPPSHKEGEALPLIVSVYGGERGSVWLNCLSFGGRSIDQALWWASQGYAFFRPDLPMQGHDPMRQLPQLLLPGINRLVELGIADNERLGIMGHSYGGYTVLSMVAQTHRFKAAVCLSGIVNLVSFYGHLSWQGVSPWTGWCEETQGRMNGSLWEKPQDYIQNSPLFHLDRVRTPVLLVTGSKDEAAVQQMNETFSGLRRLGQQTELRIYEGEDHGPTGWSRSNLLDLGQRLSSWFNQFLK